MKKKKCSHFWQVECYGYWWSYSKKKFVKLEYTHHDGNFSNKMMTKYKRVAERIANRTCEEFGKVEITKLVRNKAGWNITTWERIKV